MTSASWRRRKERRRVALSKDYVGSEHGILMATLSSVDIQVDSIINDEEEGKKNEKGEHVCHSDFFPLIPSFVFSFANLAIPHESARCTNFLSTSRAICYFPAYISAHVILEDLQKVHRARNAFVQQTIELSHLFFLHTFIVCEYKSSPFFLSLLLVLLLCSSPCVFFLPTRMHLMSVCVSYFPEFAQCITPSTCIVKKEVISFVPFLFLDERQQKLATKRQERNG